MNLIFWYESCARGKLSPCRLRYFCATEETRIDGNNGNWFFLSTQINITKKKVLDYGMKITMMYLAIDCWWLSKLFAACRRRFCPEKLFFCSLSYANKHFVGRWRKRSLKMNLEVEASLFLRTSQWFVFMSWIGCLNFAMSRRNRSISRVEYKHN